MATKRYRAPEPSAVARMFSRGPQKVAVPASSRTPMIAPYEYKDQHHEAATQILVIGNESAVTPKPLRTELSRAKKLLPGQFQDGFVFVQTHYESRGRETKVWPKVILYSLPHFREVFKDRAFLAQTLIDLGAKLAQEWNETNGSTTPYHRNPLQITYESDPFYWKSQQGVEHTTLYCYTITSFKYTAAIQLAPTFPALQPRHLTLTIKLRSTENLYVPLTKPPPGENGLQLCKSGYTAPLPHFINLLQSDSFGDFMDKLE